MQAWEMRMKGNKATTTRSCPFTLEPLEDCRKREIVFDGNSVLSDLKLIWFREEFISLG